MRVIAWVILVLAATIIFSDDGFSQIIKNDKTTKQEMFAKNRCFSKGGLGIISKGLYIVVKSDNNELIWGESDRWVGASADTAEVVIFYDGKVWLSKSLPNKFDLSSAVVISFENNKVRFFDFCQMDGGYYERLRTK